MCLLHFPLTQQQLDEEQNLHKFKPMDTNKRKWSNFDLVEHDVIWAIRGSYLP